MKTPKPYTHKEPPNPVRRFFLIIQSSLGAYTSKSYRMQMGELRTLNKVLYFLVQPDLVKKLLTSPQKTHPKSDFLEELLHNLVGQGTFVAHGENWRARRLLVDQAFKSANIVSTFPHMVKAAGCLVDRIEHTKDPVQIDELTTHVAADIIF